MNKQEQMKKIATFSLAALTVCMTFVGCDSKREPGKIYMPDMAYSRAYETYADRDTAIFTSHVEDLGGSKIFYNAMAPAGTMRRGDLLPYGLPNDSTGYKNSAEVKNPYDTVTLSKAEMEEAGRLYNINCGICHGEKGIANGPLATSGKIGGVANLTGDVYVKMTDGTMFHSITYGKNNMGSYASQLSRDQRWRIIKYVRTLQPKPAKDTGMVKPMAAVVAAADPNKKNP